MYHMIDMLFHMYCSSHLIIHTVTRWFTIPTRGGVGITTVVLPLLTMYMLYDVRCGTIV